MRSKLPPRTLERFPNLVTMFFARADALGDKPFLSRKIDGAWAHTTWREAAQQVACLSDGLRKLDLVRGDRVILVSENRPEWCIADLAIMAAGLVTVPTYTTNTERDHEHILSNSGAKAVIVSTAKLARTLLPAVVRTTDCNDIIGIEDLRIGQAGDARYHLWRDLIRGENGNIATCAQEAAQLRREDLACIIYTSGTGGAPRGVRQHHGAILHNVEACAEAISEDLGWGEEVFLSFLPPSHAFEHSAGQMLPIGMGARIAYAESLEKLAANMEEVKPTLVIVVPRLFEVLRARILKAVQKQGGVSRYLLGRALTIGARKASGDTIFLDKPMDLLLGRTLRPKVGKRFGGRIKAFICGGAPLNPDVGTFFQSLGLTVLQGYGQTEAGPVISCNRPRVGLDMRTVGRPLLNTEVRFADDGEILVRGELVMHGYWRADAETARVLKAIGSEPGAGLWLHTGDIGHFDARGRIVITDRKKDLIVNDKGDNVAPQRIEGMLTLEPEILQAMVTGDRRPYLVGVIVPDPEWAAEWAGDRGMEEAKADPAFVKAVSAAVDRVNAGLSTVEKVRRIIVADAPFTIENEQLTPSMKIRRHVIRGVYDDRLGALYKK